MKKTLSIILSFVMLFTSLVCIFTNGFVASATVGYEEDFESHAVGTNLVADQVRKWKVYDEGENGYFKGKPGTTGWAINGDNLLVSDTKATTTGGKSLAIPSWGSALKEVSVQPGKIYTLTFKYNADAVDWKDFGIYNVSNVTADGYSFKAYTAFTPVVAANRVQFYDKTLIPRLTFERDKSYTANVWNTYTATFTTTADMSKVLLAFSYEGSGSMYIDDISLTYVVDTEATAIFKDGSFENAAAQNANATLTSNNGVRSTEWKNNKPSINANGWVGSHYGSANVVKGNTTYTKASTQITTPAAKDGNQMILLTTAWQTVAKVINVEANKSYALTYWYYADSADAKFMEDMDFAIGIPANATTVTIPVTKWEADGVTINDCGGTILADGTDGQTKINYTPADGDTKTAVNAWTKRTLYFNSGTFTKVLIPFYYKNGRVYIDNVSVKEYVDLKVTVKITGKDNKNAGTASVKLSEDETTLTYTAKAFSNAVFLGWYDGETKVETAPTFTKPFDTSTYKQLEARFECLYKNEFPGGYFDDMATGTNVVDGQTLATLKSEQVNGSWKYTFTTKPGALNWFTNQGAYSSIPVVVKENGTDATNKALQIRQWANLGRVVEVKPNHKYTLNYDYYLPTGGEFGNFNIYNISNVTDNTYIGYDNLTNSTSNQFLYVDSNKNKFPEMGNNFARYSAKADYIDDDGNPVDSHDNWITRNCEFETDENTTKILIVWNPEGTQPMFIDNVVLTSTVIPKVKVVVTGEDTKNAGGAYAKLNDAQTKISYVAQAYPNGKFLGWYREGNLITNELTFTENFDADNYKLVEARFEAIYKNEFAGDSGFDSTSVGTNVALGSANTEKADKKYVIVTGYEKASENSKAKAEAAIETLKGKNINAKIIEKKVNNVDYYTIAVNPTAPEVQTAALNALGNPTNPIPEGSIYLYVFNTLVNDNGWAMGDRQVVEKANSVSDINHALQIPAWGKTVKVLDVRPNAEYRLSFDYFMALYMEFGTVAVYDVTGHDTKELVSRDDVDGLNNLFKSTTGAEFPVLYNYRNATEMHAKDPAAHDQWVNMSCVFNTTLTTKKIAVVWYPEGNTNPNATTSTGAPKPVASDLNLYIDNLVLAGTDLDYPIIPKAPQDQGELGAVYPTVGYIPVGQSETELTFMASPVPGAKFVKWQVNGVDAGTNTVYTGKFTKETVLTPIFEKVGAGNIVLNSGYENVAAGTNVLDNKNNPTIPGSWFAAWSTDGSDGNGYSSKYLDVDANGKPRPGQTFWVKASVSDDTGRSGNQSLKLEKVTYQIVGRDITGLKKNTRYLLSFWVKLDSASAYMNFVSIISKADKDAMWQNGECDSSPLITHGAGGKAITYLNKNEGSLFIDGKSSEWQKVSIAFNTGDNDAMTMFMQTIDPKNQLKALYVDDIAVEEISASQKLVNANANQGIGGYAQTSAGNGNVKAGEEVMFYATPDEGLTFKGWYKSGSAVSNSKWYVEKINADTAYDARFNVINVDLVSYDIGGYASVDKTGVFPSGTEVTFTAVPNKGNTFIGWYDANTETLVSTALVYKDTHKEDIELIARFEGNNRPAREILGLNGFEDIANDTQLKETWFEGNVGYQIFADGSTDNSWTTFKVSSERAYNGTKALLCSNRWRYTRLQLDGLNKNTTYKISFKYHMQEEDETARMYTYVGPTGVTNPDQSQSKDLMYFYDEASVTGGRGWDTYELYFNSGDLSLLEFGLKFEAATPPYSKGESHKNPWGTDQSVMYIDDLEIWEYSAQDEIISADFSGDNTAWLNIGEASSYTGGVANIPANSGIYQSVTVKPFTQYTLTFEAEAKALAAGAIGIDFVGVNSISQISSISATTIANTAMNKYTIAFTTGNEEAINIAFTNNGATVAKVDNISLDVDLVGYSEGIIEKVDFETERFAINNFFIDPTPKDNPDVSHILDCANEHPFQNEGFVIYTATSANDQNVLNGNKSLKVLAQADDEAVHKLWQSWMSFPAAKLNGNYLITFNYKFENANGGQLYLAGDAKDNYDQQHTIIAQDNKWHKASFSIDNTLGLIFLKAAIGTIAGNAGSAFYIDDVVFQLHPAMITEASTRYTYCENLYNRVDNNDFEDKITKDDWYGLPNEYKVTKGGAFTEDNYLAAGKSSTVYTRVVEVDPSQAYYVGISLRGAKGTKGVVSLMAADVNGVNKAFTNFEETTNSTFTYDGEGDWVRYGKKFVTPSNGKLAIVIDTRNGAIDVDNIMIFPIKFKYTYDPNDYYDYKPYDYSDMSNAIINGGVGEQPYYDGNLNVGRDKDPYEANGNILIYNPTYTENPVVNIIILTLSMLAGLAVVAYLIVKSKKEEVK